MARINLLPWREKLRQQRKKQFFNILGGFAVLMALVILYAHMHVSGLIENQQSRNSFLENEIRLVEIKIKEIRDLEQKREQLIARMRVIERLQGNRPEVVHTFEELVKATPEGMQLSSVTQKDRILTISGQAQSNARVSSFMRKLDASDWFSDPVLDVIETKGGGNERTREFTLRVKQAVKQEG